ncbi:MAG TPA: hemerythrin domain-containing protein [Myxococcota bacterium]|nr:hemerythrin domain-containing protein [Myxococcota bacterium]
MERRRAGKGVEERRRFLRAAASVAGIALASGAGKAACAASGDHEAEGAEVTPGEDLMQEHGVLERILLVYDEAIARIEKKQSLDLAVVTKAAGIVRRFVEDYHERQEEEFVFPRLRSAQREVELVATLLRQHERGRQLTDEIIRRSGSAAGPELAGMLRSFARMYRPHAAREDTVVFPAFRDVIGRAAYRDLGEQFEDKEHELFGEHGFETVVGEVADLERSLGIYDLASFTPA